MHPARAEPCLRGQEGVFFLNRVVWKKVRGPGAPGSAGVVCAEVVKVSSRMLSRIEGAVRDLRRRSKRCLRRESRIR